MKKAFSLQTEVLGFTLIELLIVMAIIGILSALSAFALNGARGSGRDARRKVDLQQIASGMEFFKSDCRFYPDSLPSPGSSLDGSDAPCPLTSANVYVQSIPDDPDGFNVNYVYMPTACSGITNCTQYRLWARLETLPVPTLTPECMGGFTPVCGGLPAACNYCIRNP